MSTPFCDWQITKQSIKDRGGYLFKTGIWSDCRFIVGTNQQIIDGHKLFLAMSSPVFEAMFFGEMPEKDPIPIVDVQPDAFKALLEYVYTDRINLTSFDQACELCYAAKKYMLPHLVEGCTKYLWSDLNPRNACRAYEFGKLFEEPLLIDKCIQIICDKTREVLSDTSFDEVQFNTLLDILDQNQLNIQSELDLFSAVEGYAQRAYNHSVQQSIESTVTASRNSPQTQTPENLVSEAVKKIRFLTFTPQQFADGPGKSNLLAESEKLAILMNICSPNAVIPMPSGFTTNRNSRCKAENFALKSNAKLQTIAECKKLYCTISIKDPYQCTDLNNRETTELFKTDWNVFIHGIQVSTSILLVSFYTGICANKGTPSTPSSGTIPRTDVCLSERR
ncbi:unnamed protein product [Acanthoscelides obtectus]|uniref:BTB domain-containing protein n=1 Tax=Acanthoscelides obtectus TaxID=200917 RepID=A0A9P0KS27_ACAOB|nr:unnamed protein product [Acanthoscelides obtectus]CAK1631818.1 BTB/POZ domain-containing protein 3 [Acanthoscelides obtectus]